MEARDAEDLSGPPVGSFTLIDSEVSQLLTCEDVQVCVGSEVHFHWFLWAAFNSRVVTRSMAVSLCVAGIRTDLQAPDLATGLLSSSI